jgi:diguanylate cyclase (GGDEF)-like protein
VLFRDLTTRRSEELTARYVGKEIAALLPYADVAHAVVIADAIRNAIRSLKIEHSGNRTGFVTVSAGVDERTLIRSVGEPMELILAADKALREAKRKGRNRTRGATGDFPSSATALHRH